MSVKDEVVKAVERRGPAFVPLYAPSSRDLSDVATLGYGSAADFVPSEPGATEWGFVWESLDGTMGQPKAPVITSWDQLDTYEVPDPDLPERTASFAKARQELGDKYIMGGMGVTGFNLMTLIHNFEDILMGLYVERDNVRRFADMIFGFEESMIRNLGQAGLDAVCFYDDWGTQHDLMIDPGLWREEFKPRYARQFELAHEHGMHVFFHSCGNVFKIVGDLIEIGADMVNLNQINLLGIDELAAEFAGKICFACPVDNQRTYAAGTMEDIRDEAKHMIDAFGRPNGGFLAMVERYECFGVSDEKYLATIEAFRELGTY